MCCYRTDEQTEAVKKTLDEGNGVIEAWVVVARAPEGKFFTPWRGVPVEGPGIIKSDRPSTEWPLFVREESGLMITKGKHVLLSKQEAEEYAKVMSGVDWYKHEVMSRCVPHPIRVRCRAEDFVGAGGAVVMEGGLIWHDPSAVFTQIEISPKDWDAMLQGAEEKCVA